MSEVASQTNGLFYETPAPEVDLQNFYLNDLMESFKGATPQIIHHALDAFNPQKTKAKETCWINSTAQWLTVALTWQGEADRNRLTCNLEAPDGTLVEIHSRTKTAPRRLVISMPLPTYHYGRLVDHVGQWRLHVYGSSEGDVSYQVFWIVDDPLTRLEFLPLDECT